MKKYLSLAVAALMLMGFAAGCSGSGGGGNNVITACVASEPETLDPTMNSSLDGSIYFAHLFETLIVPTGVMSEGLEVGGAESYEVSTRNIDGVDYQVYTFKIRDNKWSDGQPVKADDFAYAIERLCDADVAAPYAADIGQFFYKGLEVFEGTAAPEELGVTVIDDKTLECVMQYPVPFNLEISAFAAISPVRRDIIEANGAAWTQDPKTYVTNGMYMMESWTHDSELVLVKNPNYWNKANVRNDKIIFKLMDDDTAILAALRADELDYAQGYPMDELDSIRAEGIWHAVPQLGTYYVSMQVQQAPFDNIKVREAFVKAIDTEYIANTLRRGLVLPAYSFIGPGFKDGDGSEFYKNANPYLSTDYETRKAEAQQALADAGYPGGEGFPAVEYIYNTNSTHQLIAEALQNMWKEALGVNVTIASLDWSVMTATRRAGDYQIARNGWIADYNSPYTMLSLYMTSSGNNDTKYNSEAYDKALLDAMADPDTAGHFAKLHQAEDILMADYATAPIYFYNKEMLFKDTLKGIRTNPLGQVYLENAYVEKAQ